MKKKRGYYKKIKVADILEVPKDILPGESIITLIGKRESLIENYKGIVEYSDDKLRIKTSQGTIEFKGDHFLISYLTDHEIKITGNINEIIY